LQVILSALQDIHFHCPIKRIDDPIFTNSGQRVIIQFFCPLDVASTCGENFDYELRRTANFKMALRSMLRNGDVRNAALKTPLTNRAYAG